MIARTEIADLVAAARFFVDVGSRYDQRSIAYRIAVKRLEATADGVDDLLGDAVEPQLAELRVERCTCDRALWAFVAVIVVVLALALYGLVRLYGWFA